MNFIPIIIIIIGLMFAVVVSVWIRQKFDYQCGKCGARFSLTLSEALASMHMMGRKYVRCPRCGRWSWANPVPKNY